MNEEKDRDYRGEEAEYLTLVERSMEELKMKNQQDEDKKGEYKSGAE